MKQAQRWNERAQILENQRLSTDVFKMILRSPQVAGKCVPGQFVMVRINDSGEPLLRRPLSIAGVGPDRETLILIYRVVGRGTEMMKELSAGQSLEVLGPLGRGFDLSPRRILLIGGGIGLAPLLFVAQERCEQPVQLLAGGRCQEEMFWLELFKNQCDGITATTDDGSLGEQGTCVDILPTLLQNQHYDAILTCGPRPLMKKVAEMGAERGIPVQVSLEEHMACGLGACLTCTCDSREGLARQVCKDGPVFRAEEVKWS